MKDYVKSLAIEWLGPYYELLRDVFHVFVPFLSPYSRFYWLYILSFVLVALVLYVRSERAVASVRGFLGFIFPKHVYMSPSALLTMRYYFVNGVVTAFIRFSAVVLSATQVAIWIAAFLEESFGPNLNAPVGAGAILAFSILIIMAQDLADYLVHNLFHRVPVLWEFHKVHHCPEQITPFTNAQTHPVESITRGVTFALLGGVVIGFFNYQFLAPVQEFTVFGVGLIFFAFGLLANFRHSHIWLAYPKGLSKVLSSPAMHQIHHSKAPEHIDKNFAIIFSLWDWMFGTIYVPEKREELTLGLADEDASNYDSLLKLYGQPFIGVSRLARGQPPTQDGPV